MSLQSVCQHVFSGLAAVLSSMILIDVDGRLDNMAGLAGLAILLGLIQPLFLYWLIKTLGGTRSGVQELAN